jgi:hypothetical protein
MLDICRHSNIVWMEAKMRQWVCARCNPGFVPLEALVDLEVLDSQVPLAFLVGFILTKGSVRTRKHRIVSVYHYNVMQPCHCTAKG